MSADQAEHVPNAVKQSRKRLRRKSNDVLRRIHSGVIKAPSDDVTQAEFVLIERGVIKDAT